MGTPASQSGSPPGADPGPEAPWWPSPESVLDSVFWVACWCAWPLRQLVRAVYLQGPSLYGHGFWAGAALPDICAQLTGVRASFWAETGHAAECEDLVERRVTAFAIGSGLLASGFVTMRVLDALLWHHLWVRPLLDSRQGVRQAQPALPQE